MTFMIAYISHCVQRSPFYINFTFLLVARALDSPKSLEVDKIVEAQTDSIIGVKVGSEKFMQFSGTKVYNNIILYT